MNKLTKVFFVLAVAALLDLAAMPAMAQFTRAVIVNGGVAQNVTSLPRQGRTLGHAETGGEVVLTAANSGAIPDGSSIDFLFSVPIGNGEDGTDFQTNVLCNAAACPGIGAPGSGSAIEVVQVGNNIIRVTFQDPGDANTGFNLTTGDTVTLFGVRLNANAAAGQNVLVTMSGVSALPSTNPVTFNDPQKIVLVPLAELLADFAGTNPILTCQVDAHDVEVKITERFPAALATELQEENFSNTPEPADEAVQVVVTLTGVPAGLTVEANDVVHVNGTLTLTLDGDDTVASDGSPIVFVYNTTNSNTAAVEETGDLSADGGAPLDFTITATSGNSIAVVGTPRVITMAISLGPEDSVGDLGTIPRFLINNVVASDEVAVVTDCVTRLLYSWIVNVAGYDTGIAIANTSEDDAAYEPSGDDATSAVAQGGPCVLTGYPAAGGTPISFTTASIPAGQTLAFTISSVTGFSGFSGYVLAVCNFLNAHSFFFTTDGFGGAAAPNLAQGGQALVVSNAARVLANGEGLGH
jgi:hypothetical protein